MRLRRRIVAVLATASVFIVSLVSFGSPAAAAGGGCSPDWNYNNWRFSACSADDGVRVYGDSYVNQVGTIPSGGTCQMYMRLIDLSNNNMVVASRYDGCYFGHHPAISASKVPGHRYSNWVSLNFNCCIAVNRQQSPETY